MSLQNYRKVYNGSFNSHGSKSIVTNKKDRFYIRKSDLNLKIFFYPLLVLFLSGIKTRLLDVFQKDYKCNNLNDVVSKGFSNRSYAYKTINILIKNAIHNVNSKEYNIDLNENIINDIRFVRKNNRNKNNNCICKKKEIKIKNYIYNQVPISIILSLATFGNIAYIIYYLKPNWRKDLQHRYGIYTTDTDILHHIFLLKDLRNAVAHNNIIIDSRFKNGYGVNKFLIKRLEKSCCVKGITFNSICDYLLLLLYYQAHMFIKSRCRIKEVYDFVNIVSEFLNNIPSSSRREFSFIFPNMPHNEGRILNKLLKFYNK